MVDYTKKELRQESWLRWKGGAKLAEDLRQFYTNKRVWDRLAAQNPLAPTAGSGGAGSACTGCAKRRQWLLKQLGNRGAMKPEKRMLMALKNWRRPQAK